MQEEANQKTVGIVVEGGKFTGRMFLRACDKRYPFSAVGRIILMN